MYHKNNYSLSTQMNLQLDKNRRQEHNRNLDNAFTSDEDLNSALDYLYDKNNQSKTQGFLKTNGFPSKQEREASQTLHGIQQERKQMQNMLKEKTAGILKPNINDSDRSFLHGLLGEEDGEHEYQKEVSAVKRKQMELYDAFRGSQFESRLMQNVSTNDYADELKNERSGKLREPTTKELVNATRLQQEFKASTHPNIKMSSSDITDDNHYHVLNTPLSTLALNKFKNKDANRTYGVIYRNGHSDCINGQGCNNDVYNLSYGADTIANNGCELLAVHNALAMKNNKRDFKEIIEVAEKTKGVMWLGGHWGSRSNQLGNLLEHYEQKYISTTQRESFNALLEDGGIYILSTWNRNSLTIHTVAFSCDSENNIIVYNRYSNSLAPYRYNATGQQSGLDLYLKECGKEIVLYKLK